MIHLYLFDKEGRASAYAIGTYIRSVISVCVRLPFIITVVHLKVQGDFLITVSEKGVRSINIPILREIEGDEKKEDRKKNCQEVVSILKPYISNTDSLIFHLNYTQDYFLADTLKTEWPDSKVVLTVHYFTWCFALYGNYSYLAHIINKEGIGLSDFEKEVIYSGLFEQQLFKITDKIICLSQFAQEILQDYYDIPLEKTIFIPNGLPDKYQEKDSNLIRQLYHIPPEEKMILFVGRLDRIKGVSYLIEAFKEVIKEIPEAHLYLIGDGRFADYISLCNPCWNKITFCGKLQPEQVFDFYRMSNLGVLPSMHEQCSYVAIEMMMHGLPFIGSTSTGLDEMIKEGVNGYKVHLQEDGPFVKIPIADFSTLIIKMLKLKSLKKISFNNQKLYLEKYTDIKMENKLKCLYSSLWSRE